MMTKQLIQIFLVLNLFSCRFEFPEICIEELTVIPIAAKAGEIITIKGDKLDAFDPSKGDKIIINNQLINLLDANPNNSNNELQILIPEGLNTLNATVKIEVQFKNDKHVSEGCNSAFVELGINSGIERVTPNTGKCGDKIIIEGDFRTNIDEYEVWFWGDGISGNSIEGTINRFASTGEMEVVVPYRPKENSSNAIFILDKRTNEILVKHDALSYEYIQIESLVDSVGQQGNFVMLKGKNFRKSEESNYKILLFEHKEANLVVVNDSIMEIEIPIKPIDACLVSKIKFINDCEELIPNNVTFNYQYKILEKLSITHSNFKFLKGLTIDKHGVDVADLYVTDSENYIVHKIKENYTNFSTDISKYAGIQGIQGHNIISKQLDKARFSIPNDIAFLQGSDDLFVVDQGSRQIRRIGKFDGIDGKGLVHNCAGNRNFEPFINTINSTCASSFTAPEGITIANDGTIYFSDLLLGVFKIELNKSDPNCSFIGPEENRNKSDSGQVTLLLNQLDLKGLPHGIDISDNGRQLFIALPFNQQIIVYDLTINEIETIIELGVDNNPKDLIFEEKSKTLFFIDNLKNRLGYISLQQSSDTRIVTIISGLDNVQGITLTNRNNNLILYTTQGVNGVLKKLILE